jgi:chromosome transmission fidelity protein 18
LYIDFNADIDNKNEIWLEKYRPQKFADLLTDERINREILTWLKSWDEIVFNRKFNPTALPNYKELNNGGLLQQAPIKKEIEYVQSKHKIILIAGPPGIGKTTLARVIAEHCGYESLVVNKQIN